MNISTTPSFDPIHPDTPDQPKPESDYTTPNYFLLLWKSGTITSWLTQLNINFLKIDKIMFDLQLRTSIDGEVPPEAINEIIELTKKVTELETFKTETEETLKLNNETITNLQTQVTVNNYDINTLLVNYTNLDTRMSTAEVNIQTLREAIEKLQSNYESLEQRVAALEAKP